MVKKCPGYTPQLKSKEAKHYYNEGHGAKGHYLLSQATIWPLLCLFVWSCSSTTAVKPSVDQRNGSEQGSADRKRKQPKESPPKAENQPPEQLCLPVLPMSPEAKKAGIRRLKHQVHPSNKGFQKISAKNSEKVKSFPKKQVPLRSLTVLPIGAPTLVKGIVFDPSQDRWLSMPWVVPLDFKIERKKLPSWISVNTKGQVIMTAPAELEGMIVQISGKSSQDKWVKKYLGFGKRAVAHWEVFKHHYVPTRRADPGLGIKTKPGDKSISDVDVDLVALLTNDVNGDGQAEIIIYAVGHYKKNGESVGQRGELGIVSSKSSKRTSSVATAIFGLDQGVIFPRFRIAPPKLNGGQRLFFSAVWCCSGVSVRAFRLAQDGFKPLSQELAEGKMRVCLVPSATGWAQLKLIKSESNMGKGK